MTMIEDNEDPNDVHFTVAASNFTNDKKEVAKLLKEISQGAKNTRNCVHNLIEQVKSGAEEDGISFLHMKNRLLASYTSNLGLLMLRKCYGKELDGENAIDRLVETRTVLEKIRPIDQKLRYQVDKLVNIAESGAIDKNDPLRYKPNPSGLMSKLAEESGSASEEDDNDAAGEKSKSDAKFRPPRNVPQFYGGGDKEEVEQIEGEKKKKHALSRSIMDSIKEQYMDTPEELSHKADVMRKKFIDEEREKTRLEEENFIRLPVTKADRARKKAMMTMGSLGDDLTSFGRSVYEDGQISGLRGKKRKSGAPNSAKSSRSKSHKKFKKRK